MWFSATGRAARDVTGLAARRYRRSTPTRRRTAPLRLFADIAALQVAGQWDEAGQLLAVAARGLEAAGAELLVICTNTMHKVADQVQAAVGIPLLHLGDATAQAVAGAGLRTVGLLGTAFTMEQDFYRDRLTSHGLEVLIPPIYDELCLGVIREESRQVYRDVILGLVQSGAQAVVLGCTEIELLISGTDSPVPVFPTTGLHVEAAVAASVAMRGPSGAPRVEPFPGSVGRG